MKILQLASTTALAMAMSILPLVIVGGDVIKEDQDFLPQHIINEVGRNLQIGGIANAYDPFSRPVLPPLGDITVISGKGGDKGKGFGVGGDPQVCKDLKRMNCRKEPSCKWSKKKMTCIKKKIRKKKKNPGNQGHGGDEGKGNGQPCQNKKRKKCKMSNECRWNKNGRVCIPMPY